MNSVTGECNGRSIKTKERKVKVRGESQCVRMGNKKENTHKKTILYLEATKMSFSR